MTWRIFCRRIADVRQETLIAAKFYSLFYNPLTTKFDDRESLQ